MMWLTRLFDDVGSLRWLSNVLQWVSISLVFLGGLLQLAKFTVDRRERAISAAVQASQLESIRSASESVRLEAAQANDRAAKTETTAGEANRLAEVERQARAGLEARLAPRRLPEEQKRDLVARLGGSDDLQVYFVPATPAATREVLDFMADFRDVFQRLGNMQLNGEIFFSSVPTPARGVKVYVRDSSFVRAAAETLNQALVSWGFDSEIAEAGVPRGNQIYLSVGPKQ